MVWRKFGELGPAKSIEIPVKGSNEVVEVFLDELPEDPSGIKDILIEETAPLHLFLLFSVYAKPKLRLLRSLIPYFEE